jgi:hypothetical protein
VSLLPRVLLCALLGLAVVPAAASAAGTLPPAVAVPAADALMAQAHTLAVAHWGMDPCDGQVSVTWAHMGAGINARSQWMSTNVADPSTYSDCSISYNLDVDWDWPKLCTVVEHEMGHLSGHDHVNDPHDVMSPYYIYPSPECAAGTAAATPEPAPDPTPVASSRASTGHKTARHKATKSKRRKPTAAARKAAARRAARARARAAKERAVVTRATGARASGGSARVAVAVAADSSSHAGLFGCVLAST